MDPKSDGAEASEQERGPSPGAPANGVPLDEVPLEERKWAFFAHLSALSGLVIPFGNLLGPLVIWQIKRYEMPFVARQAKEALNFQITASLALVLCSVLVLFVIGFLLLPIVVIAAVALTIIAAVSANDGKEYRYPFTWRLVA